jgi:pimeloyl-ACP methyl ester carboxylesterase
MATTPVLLLPGLLEDADAFGHQLEGLRQLAAFTVADLTRAESIAELARQALAQAPPGPIAIAGHSMGGYVALEILRQAPERITRAAFLNTHARPDSPEATENRRRLMALAEKDFPAVISTLVPKLVSEEHLRDDELTGIISGMALGVGKDAFLRQERAIIGRADSRAHLANIACRTLVVAAREDQLMPVELLKELADGIRGSALAIVEDSGHMASLEQPEKVTELLRGWLQG